MTSHQSLHPVRPEMHRSKKNGTLAGQVGFAAHTPLRSSFSHGVNGASSARVRSGYPVSPPIVSVGPHRALYPPAPSPTSLSSSSTSNRGSPRPLPVRTPTHPIGASAPPLPPKQNRKPPPKMPDPAPPAAPDHVPTGAGSTLTIPELREIAARQQQQVESQQKLLRQREERLRMLRSQEEQQRQFVRSNPALFQLREKVEQQELQLRRLRTLRGQMEQFQTNNENLASELTMIQTLCSEKERDLANCIRKANQLAAQMADLNRTRQQQAGPNNGAVPPHQLEAKRRELQHRYPVPLGAKLSEQSHQLQARQSEADHLDRRISEMRQRLMQRHRAQRQVPGNTATTNNPAAAGASPSEPAPVPLNGEPVSAFLQRQNDATSSTGSSSNSSLFSAPAPPGPATTTSSSSSSQTPGRAQPRYASRSVIQDTYTRRQLISTPNLERYKSKAHEIYRANLSQLNVDKLSARTNTPRQVMAQHRRHRHSSSSMDDLSSPVSATQPPLQPTPEPEPEPVGGDSGTEESSTSSQVESAPAVVTESPPRSPASRPLSKKSCLKPGVGEGRASQNVTFEPLYLLLDGSLEGEMEVVRRAATQIDDVSACTEEGITALHTAICAGQDEVVDFLVKFGANVNAVDADGWSPLHCAASCNNLNFVRLLVEHGAAIFLRTLSDYETALEKCEGEEDTGCAECLYNYQERLGVSGNGLVYAAFPYDATNEDELSFRLNDALTVVRKGDANEKEWYWGRDAQGQEGYVPRNFLALSPSIVRRSRVSASPLRGPGPAGVSSAQRPGSSPAGRIPSDHSDQTAL